MIIDIKNLLDYIEINGVVSFDNLEGTNILKLNDIKVFGTLDSNFDLNITIDGVMVLPCSVSLKPVDYAFEINVSERIDEKSLKKEQNTIDILPIIWENILTEIPIRVVSDDLSDITKSGEGWKLVESDE